MVAFRRSAALSCGRTLPGRGIWAGATTHTVEKDGNGCGYLNLSFFFFFFFFFFSFQALARVVGFIRMVHRTWDGKSVEKLSLLLLMLRVIDMRSRQKRKSCLLSSSIGHWRDVPVVNM